MSTAPRHLEFAPPPTPGMLRALGLAIVAHLVLLAVLTAGVQWKREAVQETIEAELWSAVPQQAAPPAPEPEPEPEPPKPVPQPEPKPQPTPPPAEVQLKADIAIAKENAKRLQDKQRALEQQALEKKKQVELDKQTQAKLEQEKKDKLKKEQAEKLAAEKDKLKKDQESEAAAAKARADQIKRLERLAGTDGNATGAGTAAKSSGPSAGYTGLLIGTVKPRITYPDNINGNPRVEVEIRTAPSGRILSTRITQSSGVKSWDEAVIRAIEKTEVLPKDVDGSIPNPLLMGFRPKD